MRRVTLEDLALHLGVARSTVSRALRDDPQIGATTRERVHTLARELGYRPNAAARALNRHRAGAVGLMLPRSSAFVFANPYFSDLLHGVAEAAEEGGQALLVSTSRTPDYSSWIREGRVDGLLLLGSSVGDGDVATLNELLAAGVAIVAIHGGPRALRAVSIGANERAGIWQALAHLSELGHRRVAFLAGPREVRYARRRERAYHSGVTTFGLEVDDALVVHGQDTRESGAEALDELLRRGTPFDAVVANNDLVAIGACEALAAAGRAVPADVSVVGFDDNQLASMVRPALTTVRQPVREIGAVAMRTLLALLAGETVEDRRLATRLVVRDSTRAKGGTP